MDKAQAQKSRKVVRRSFTRHHKAVKELIDAKMMNEARAGFNLLVRDWQKLLALDEEVLKFMLDDGTSEEDIEKEGISTDSYANQYEILNVIMQDFESGLFKLQELVKSPPGSRTEMYIRQANPNSYRHVLREIRQKEIFKLIVDTNPANMNLFFRAILQLQMNDYRYHYMFTTFDIETFDLEDFKYNSVNMTAFRLVDVESPKVADLLHQMERFQPIGHAILNRSGIIKIEFMVYKSANSIT